jgi:hypothetical protein
MDEAARQVDPGVYKLIFEELQNNGNAQVGQVQRVG